MNRTDFARRLTAMTQMCVSGADRLKLNGIAADAEQGALAAMNGKSGVEYCGKFLAQFLATTDLGCLKKLSLRYVDDDFGAVQELLVSGQRHWQLAKGIATTQGQINGPFFTRNPARIQ